MPKRSKRYQALVSKIKSDTAYPIAEAVALVKQTANTKFDSAVEAHFRLGIDTSKGDQQIRGTVSLPHGTGRTKRIAAFVSQEKEKEAQQAGADVVGGDELIQSIKGSAKIDFDIAIATPDMMPKLAVIAKTLGPIGLMPSPKNETITTNLAKTIGELKKGKVNYKNDTTGNIHQVIGRASFTDGQLKENFEKLLESVRKAKPATSKGDYIKNITLTSTMGPGIRVTPN